MTPDQQGAGGGEKTEKATPKKRRDARKKGQVLKSSEVNTAVLTITMFVVLFAFGGHIVSGINGVMTHFFYQLGHETASPVSQEDIASSMFIAVREFFLIMLPFIAAALLVGILVNVAQFGFLLSAEAMKPKFSKINPIEGVKRIFSVRSIIELLKSILKIGLMTLVIYLEYRRNIDVFPGMMDLTILQAAGVISDMALSIAIRAAVVLIVIGIADYIYQWWEFERKLKMSKEEVKQEIKQMEGDPLIRQKRKEKQRQMSMMRMMRDIPKADVVITNPTHYAVALVYKETESDAPIVLAKGKDHLALKIKQIAEEHNVEIVENKPVAQALYASCEISQRIPYEMFATVAEILSYVYKKRNTHFAPRPPERTPIRAR